MFFKLPIMPVYYCVPGVLMVAPASRPTGRGAASATTRAKRETRTARSAATPRRASTGATAAPATTTSTWPAVQTTWTTAP